MNQSLELHDIIFFIYKLFEQFFSFQIYNYIEKKMQEFIQIIITLTILAIFIGLSQSVGQGGGPIINVCLMVGLGYSTKKSINYSYVILLGASLASIIQNCVKSHRNKQSLIDFDLILVTLPMMLSGSIIGIVLKQFMSQLVKTIFLTFLLTSLIFKSFQNYQKTIRQQKNRQQNQPINQQDEDQVLRLPQSKNQKYQQLKKQNIFYSILMIIFIIGYTVLIELIRGGRKFNSILGYEPCNLQYWICNGIHILFSFIISFSLAEKYQKNKKQNDNFLYYIMIGFFAGIAGGSLGLGGAVILVPSWLTLGIEANKVVTNSIPLIFSTSLSLFFVSTFSKNYQLVEVFYFLILSFISSFIIRRLVEYIIKKFNLKSAIYIVIIFILIVSLLILLPYQYKKYSENPEAFLRFGQFC